MDKPRRDLLRSVIGKARRDVEENLRRQLVGYGLFTDTPALSQEDLPLRPEQEGHYRRVLDAVSREGRATGNERRHYTRSGRALCPRGWRDLDKPPGCSACSGSPWLAQSRGGIRIR